MDDIILKERNKNKVLQRLN